MKFTRKTTIGFPKQQLKTAVPEKQSVVSLKQSVVYTSKQQTKLKLKS